MSADQFRAWLEGRGWTQAEVAEALGVTQPAVSRWVTGAAPVTRRTLAQLRMLDRTKRHTRKEG